MKIMDTLCGSAISEWYVVFDEILEVSITTQWRDARLCFSTLGSGVGGVGLDVAAAGSDLGGGSTEETFLGGLFGGTGFFHSESFLDQALVSRAAGRGGG